MTTILLLCLKFRNDAAELAAALCSCPRDVAAVREHEQVNNNGCFNSLFLRLWMLSCGE